MTSPLFLQVRKKFGYHVEGFFATLTAIQFHLLFYSTRPLPNILAFGLGAHIFPLCPKASFKNVLLNSVAAVE